MNKNELFCDFFVVVKETDSLGRKVQTHVDECLVDWRELADCLSDSRICDVGNKTVFREEVTSHGRDWEAGDQEVRAGGGDSEAEREQRFQEAQGITMWLTRKHERRGNVTDIRSGDAFFFFFFPTEPDELIGSRWGGRTGGTGHAPNQTESREGHCRDKLQCRRCQKTIEMA